MGRGHEFGTREFFDAVERHRYTEYAPWMPELMGFTEFAGARLLEVGCGMGRTFCSCPRGAQVTGVDLTSRSIQISRQHFAVYGEGGDLQLATQSTCRSRTRVLTPFIPMACSITRRTPAGAVCDIHRVLRAGGWRG